jgi:hypothetical protein
MDSIKKPTNQKKSESIQQESNQKVDEKPAFKKLDYVNDPKIIFSWGKGHQKHKLSNSLMFLKYRERISCSVILQIILMPAYNP